MIKFSGLAFGMMENHLLLPSIFWELLPRFVATEYVYLKKKKYLSVSKFDSSGFCNKA